MHAYESVEFTQNDGIVEVRLHTDGSSLLWNPTAHRELGDALIEVAGDRDVKVVIVTGTGESFCSGFVPNAFTNRRGWETIWWEGKRIIKGLLDLDVPVIGAVNGPALVHAEVPLLADVVLAADTAVFADKAHFVNGVVPGDGVHLVWPFLLGPRRGKYFLLTGQEISAQEALELGIVNEVLPPEAVLERAWELARSWASLSLPVLRYTREALNIFERRQLLDGISHGLALEGTGLSDAALEAPR